MKCPSCGLENHSTAPVCDCGYVFETHAGGIDRKKKRNPFLAGIATFGVYGLGQLYNGKPRKAAIAYGALWAITLFGALAPIASNFGWIFIYLVLQLALLLFLIVDAVSDARSQRSILLHWYNRWYIYLGIMVIQMLVILPVQVKLLKLSATTYRIPTRSMEPAIKLGNRLVADMKAYKTKGPQRGDIVIFKYPKDESVPYIKRVIGLPGEKVEIIGRTLLINGKELKESYVQHIDLSSEWGHWGPVQIPPDHFFLLGDNRDNSFDSRYFGSILRSKFLGKARYLYWANEWSRIGRPLN
jgi:signal peptidase I